LTWRPEVLIVKGFRRTGWSSNDIWHI